MSMHLGTGDHEVNAFENSSSSNKSTLCKKCSYLKFFGSVFSGIQTKYGHLQGNSPYSFQMWENIGQKNSEYGHFLHSDSLWVSAFCSKTLKYTKLET